MKLQTFPHLVREENSTVTIYHRKSGKYHEFKLAYFLKGIRKTQTFSTFEKAKERADAINDSVNAGELEAVSLSRFQAQDSLQAMNILAWSGLSLSTVATQFTEAKKLLGSAPLVEAAQFYKSKHETLTPKAFAEVKEEYLKIKRARGITPRAVDGLEGLLTRFEQTYHCDLAAITAKDVASFLSGTPKVCQNPARRVAMYSAASFNTYRNSLFEFFRFAIRKKYLASDWNGMEDIELRTLPPEQVEIFTPKDMARLLSACPADGNNPELKTYLAIGAFRSE